MTSADVARAVLESALAASANPISLTVRPRRIDLLVQDHRILVEVRGGVLRVVWVAAPVGDGPATREERIAIDDTDQGLVAGMVKRAATEWTSNFWNSALSIASGESPLGFSEQRGTPLRAAASRALRTGRAGGTTRHHRLLTPARPPARHGVSRRKPLPSND